MMGKKSLETVATTRRFGSEPPETDATPELNSASPCSERFCARKSWKLRSARFMSWPLLLFSETFTS